MSYVIDPGTSVLVGLCARYLRAPSSWSTDPVTGTRTLTFDPPLSVEEQAVYASLEALSRATLDLSPADWAAIETRLPALRTFRQQTRSEFMALTATERDRATFDALQDIIAVLVAMLRDK